MRGQTHVCPIHGTKLIEAVTPLDKNSFLTDEYIQAQMDLFPYSNKIVYIGLWDSYPTESRARIEYCPKCREAEDRWLKQNPEHRPRTVDKKEILTLRDQNDQKKWKCSIHNEPFGWRLTVVRYNVHLTPEYIEAQQRLFPNSFFNVVVEGPRTNQSPKFAGMGFCWKCWNAEREWCIQNPGLCIGIPPERKIIDPEIPKSDKK